MAGKFEREPWLDGNLEDHNRNSTGTLVTPSNDFYIISIADENRSGGAGTTTLRDGGAGGTIIVTTTTLDDVTSILDYNKAPLLFSTDVHVTQPAGGGRTTITGYDY